MTTADLKKKIQERFGGQGFRIACFFPPQGDQLGLNPTAFFKLERERIESGEEFVVRGWRNSGPGTSYDDIADEATYRL